MTFEDLLYEVKNGVAWITINRPDKMNAFRGQTCDEIIRALNKAGYDRDVGCIVLAGAGDRAFCTGGDQGTQDGGYGGRGIIGDQRAVGGGHQAVLRRGALVAALEESRGGHTAHQQRADGDQDRSGIALHRCLQVGLTPIHIGHHCTTANLNQVPGQGHENQRKMNDSVRR